VRAPDSEDRKAWGLELKYKKFCFGQDFEGCPKFLAQNVQKYFCWELGQK
jgi:hypothetical protein